MIQDLEKKGVTFIEDLAELQPGQRVIFSAHGVSQQVYQEAQERALHFIDATCPLVKKIHKKALFFSKKGIPTILIGHKKHQEIIGTAGYIKPELLFIVERISDIAKLPLPADQAVGYLTQTTLSVTESQDLICELKKRFPKLIDPFKNYICFATQNRQNAVLELTKGCDLIVICGSPSSSNSTRLKETASQHGIEAYMIDSADELSLSWLQGKKHIGISSGASTPYHIVEEVIAKIKHEKAKVRISQKESVEKNLTFALPKI